jgi:dTDP-4-dehydrorhamnose reductase
VKALVAGASGQLGQALVTLLGDRVAAALDRHQLDVRAPAAVEAALLQARPDVVFNASAYNKVDAAESEPDQAFDVNALGPLNLARACAKLGARLVHVSTDYVFDGSGTRPWREDDRPGPLGVYGASKLAGEHLVAAAAGPAWLVVRTSAVLGAGASRGKGGSFVERILARARAGEPLRVVTDQRLSPTYAPDLAVALLALVEAGAAGLWHVTGAEPCHWHELAVAAVAAAGLSVPVAAVTQAELGAAARRPANSVLDTGRYRGAGLPPLRSWREAVAVLAAPSLSP